MIVIDDAMLTFSRGIVNGSNDDPLLSKVAGLGILGAKGRSYIGDYGSGGYPERSCNDDH